MAKLYLLLFSMALFVTTNAQTNTLYSKSYGHSDDPPIIFIHGGPSGNATLFEGTTAELLATKGFYVIVYDRRGEGRSVDTTASFTYQEAINDLNDIYKTYKIEKANIIAHSFGGLVATLFAQQCPAKVNSLVMAGALFSQQETYDHILKTTKRIYKEKKDSLMLAKIAAIENSDNQSAAYRKQCFEIAGQNDYFKMPFPTTDANRLREKYEQSEFYKRNTRNQQAPVLFYKNEPRKNIDVKAVLAKLKQNHVKLFAVYGRQDKIFSSKQFNDMKRIVSKRNFRLIDNCSHYLFVDQQQVFIQVIEKWLKDNVLYY